MEPTTQTIIEFNDIPAADKKSWAHFIALAHGITESEAAQALCEFNPKAIKSAYGGFYASDDETSKIMSFMKERFVVPSNKTA